jgi:hypothetical protein
MRIAKEKELVSGTFNDARVVCDATCNDAEDTERVEV